MKNLKLVCTNCRNTYPITGPNFRCDCCGEPLELETVVVRGFSPAGGDILKKYADFFPFVDVDPRLSLGEGTTPLTLSRRSGAKGGLRIYFKNEGMNPTWSFKDRGTYAAIAHAVALGFKKIGTVSTGNMAASVAAYGARAGLETKILVKEGLPEEKLGPIAIYNPDLIKVDGDYGSLYFESLKLGRDRGIYFMNSDSPFRVEGSKTIAFEIAEQLDFDVPDYVIIPTSAGGNIRGIMKGFREYFESGLTEKMPVFVCAQAEGCSPICTAYGKGDKNITRFDEPETIAHAIENPFPPSGNTVLRLLRETGGLCVQVDDAEILSAQKELATEGLFVQPASAVSLAAVEKLRTRGAVAENSRIVCILTGSGLKYQSALKRQLLAARSCRIEDLAKEL